MKLLINTATTFQGGGVQVAQSLIEECKQIASHEYHIILGEKLSNMVDPNDFPENMFFYSIGYRPATRVFSLKSQDHYFKTLEERIKPDVVFTTTGPAYWRPQAPHLVGYNLPHYIYRDSPFFAQIPLYKRLKWALKGKVLKFFFKRDADAYVVQTDDVNKRLRQWVQSEAVYTVSNTFSRHYIRPKAVPDKLPSKKTGEFRFLSLSAWYAHKNLGIIPKVINALPAEMKDRVRFVLTLPEETLHRYFSQGIGDSILNVGPVKPDEGPALYNECDALFLPTLLECFSASYAEAMKMEKPIITSDLGFAHTVCGEAALYADPMDPHEIAEKIVKLIKQPHLQEKLIQKGMVQQRTFSNARERAEQYLRICKDLADAG